MTKIIGREVLGRNLMRRSTVEIEEWDGSVIVRELTGAEVAECKALVGQAVDLGSKTIANDQSAVEFTCKLVALGWINEDGSKVISSEDSHVLSRESFSITLKMAQEIGRLSGLMPGAVETAKKN